MQTVSVSELRNNMSHYLDRVVKGTCVLIRDEKRGITIAQLTKTSAFDKDTYEKTLRRSAGVFSEDNHPEWKTKAAVTSWLEKIRLADERSF